MTADFAQNAALIATALVTALIGVLKYVKTEVGKHNDKPPVSDGSSIVAASFIDSRLLKELIETLKIHMEEFGKESRKMNRNRQELTTALEESTDAVLANTDATLNMLRFIRREQNKVDDG